MDWTIFFYHFLDHFLDHFKGGESTPLVLRKGRDAVYQYSGRGERRTITTQGGVGGGCNSKQYRLMELLLDRTNFFTRFFD